MRDERNTYARYFEHMRMHFTFLTKLVYTDQTLPLNTTDPAVENLSVLHLPKRNEQSGVVVYAGVK